MRQGAQGWCTGMTQRDGMGREVEGGFRMGNTCKPMADSCQCMAKTTKILKSNQLPIKIIFKKHKKIKIQCKSDYALNDLTQTLPSDSTWMRVNVKATALHCLFAPNPYLSDLYSYHSHLAHYVLATIVFCFSYMPWTLSPYKLYTGCFFFLVHSYLRYLHH